MDTTSDAYYDAIDSRIRTEFPHKFQDTGTVEVAPSAQNGKRSSVQRVASANRAAKSTGRDTIRLTPSQVAIAKKLGVSLEDYARQVKEIQANV
jgi:phage I-like protein